MLRRATKQSRMSQIASLAGVNKSSLAMTDVTLRRFAPRNDNEVDMSIKIDISDRLKKLPPYLFVEIDKAKKRAKEEGRDVIDLGVGDPDQPTPSYIIDALNQAVKDPSTHRYALDQGMEELRIAISDWYKKRFNVILDPKTEVLPLIGSKEGISHMPLALVNPGDVTLVPDPCYPPYRSGTLLAGGDFYDLPLKEENLFLPDLGSINKSTLNKAKILYLNYPNNPTAAVCDTAFYNKAIEFALKNNIMIASDAAYTEISYGGYLPSSFLEAKGAKEVGVEFHSLSKTYNMTGWRIGWVCGNKDIIKGIAKVKANVDSGIFSAIQRAGIVALKGRKSELESMKKLYQERRDVVVNGLNSIGWKTTKPKATFYIWTKVVGGRDSATMCKLLLDHASVVVTPGSGFGKHGESYIRIALTVPKERLAEAIDRIKKAL